MSKKTPTKIDQILEDLSVAERITFLEYLAARYALGSFGDMPLNIKIADQTGAVRMAKRTREAGTAKGKGKQRATPASIALIVSQN
ncbi:hypothetical protein IFM46972_00367 [Aspergillus udagawae]|uniref:Uncharacterized protein n=1 Tax=Aspergillus udagawae TaxID=91492 RepID=A0A8H3MYR7_9EURO|nr:hypothetical protein IFM46972_00367 [Aspergillus udagawae]